MSQSTQDSLRVIGVNAIITQEGENVRISWRNGNGSKLAFVLTRVRTDRGESTRVHFEVDKNVDSKAGLQVLADVEAKHGKASL